MNANVVANPAIGKARAMLGTFRESFTLFWGERNARERAMLSVGAGAVLLLLLYVIFFAPALRGRAQLNRDLPLLRQQAAEMQSLARRAAELNNGAAVQAEPISQESISASLSARGMKPKNLSVVDGTVRLQLDLVSFAGLLDWIGERQRVSHLAVLEANFIASPQLDMVNASLTLKQQGNVDGE